MWNYIFLQFATARQMTKSLIPSNVQNCLELEVPTTGPPTLPEVKIDCLSMPELKSDMLLHASRLELTKFAKLSCWVKVKVWRSLTASWILTCYSSPEWKVHIIIQFLNLQIWEHGTHLQVSHLVSSMILERSRASSSYHTSCRHILAFLST